MAKSTSPPSDASSLCVSCGLCCNGVLFAHAKAEREEVPRLEAAGLQVRQVDEQLNFGLPCRHLDEGRCTIYEDRFAICRSFRCVLLKRLQAGEVELPEALATVAKAKAMIARVAALEPEAAQVSRRLELRRQGPPRGGETEAAGAALRLWVESLALDTFLDGRFRNKPAKKPSGPSGGKGSE
jgi:Fe-S-cluster containining protein